MGFTLLDDAPAPQLPPKGRFVLLDDAAEPAPTRSTTEQVGRQVGLTARAGAKGVVAIPTMLSDALVQLYNMGAGGVESVTGIPQTRYGAPSQAQDQLLNRVLPAPENSRERIAGDVAGAMSGQGVVAKLGSFMAKQAEPVVSRLGEILNAERGTQVVSAGTGTAASSKVREEGGSPIAQFVTGLGTSAGTSVAMAGRPRGSMPARNQDVVDTAAEHDVPLTYSDVTGKGKRLDTWLEGTPFVGTSKFREQGAQKVTAAAERVTAGAKDELDTTNFRGMKDLKLAAQDGDKGAQRTLEQINNAGDDWQKIMQASGNLKLWRSRQVADQLYGKVEQLAQPRGNMPLTKTSLALDDAIAAETSSKLPDQKLLDTLTTLRNNLTGPGKVTDFSAARALRSDMGDIIASSYKGENALVGAKGVGKLSAVQGALEQDMEQFAVGAGGDLAKAWKRADEFYKNAVVPYKDKALAKALSSDTPDEIYSQFIRVGRSGAGEDRAVKFYGALDPKGKAAVRYGMLSNAMDDAAIAGKDTISPAKFASSLEKVAPGAGVFFQGEDKKALDGFVNLMRHAERFGQYAENPPTGQRVIPLISVLGAAAWPKLAAAIGGSALVAREVTTRPALRDALIRASNAKLSPVELDKLTQEVAKLVPQAAATSTRSASPQQQ